MNWDAAAPHAQSDFAVPLVPRESRRADSAHAALPRRRRLRRRPRRGRGDGRTHSRRRSSLKGTVHPGARSIEEEEEIPVKWGAPLAAAMARLGRQGRRHCPRHQTKECVPSEREPAAGGEVICSPLTSRQWCNSTSCTPNTSCPGSKTVQPKNARSKPSQPRSQRFVSFPLSSVLAKTRTLTPSRLVSGAARQDFRTCQSHIRRIAEQSQSLLANRPRDPVEAELKRIDLIMAANVQTALATRVQELSTTFRKKQADYLRRESLGSGGQC